MGVYIKWVILIIVLLFFITFGVKNSGPVYLNYYHIQNLELPLYALVYIAILVGIFVGMIVGILSRLSLGRKVRILEKENKRLGETVKEPEIETAIEEQAPAPM